MLALASRSVFTITVAYRARLHIKGVRDRDGIKWQKIEATRALEEKSMTLVVVLDGVKDVEIIRR